jgi:hypothetical protein
LEEVINVVNECCPAFSLGKNTAQPKKKQKKRVRFGKSTPQNPFGYTYSGGSRRKRRTRRRH